MQSTSTASYQTVSQNQVTTMLCSICHVNKEKSSGRTWVAHTNNDPTNNLIHAVHLECLEKLPGTKKTCPTCGVEADLSNTSSIEEKTKYWIIKNKKAWAVSLGAAAGVLSAIGIIALTRLGTETVVVKGAAVGGVVAGLILGPIVAAAVGGAAAAGIVGLRGTAAVRGAAAGAGLGEIVGIVVGIPAGLILGPDVGTVALVASMAIGAGLGARIEVEPTDSQEESTPLLPA